MTATIDFGKRTAQYIALRDKIAGIRKKHTEELAPYIEKLDALNIMLLGHLNSVGTTSASIKGVGTVYKKEVVSATLADPEAFRDYIVKHGDWDMADIKANKTAVKEYVDANGQPPVGVNYSVSFDVGVRRD